MERIDFSNPDRYRTIFDRVYEKYRKSGYFEQLENIDFLKDEYSKLSDEERKKINANTFEEYVSFVKDDVKKASYNSTFKRIFKRVEEGDTAKLLGMLTDVNRFSKSLFQELTGVEIEDKSNKETAEKVVGFLKDNNISNSKKEGKMKKAIGRIEEAEDTTITRADVDANMKRALTKIEKIIVKIKGLEAEVTELKKVKKDLEPPIIEFLKKVEKTGIELNKIKIFLSSGKTSPSMTQVLDEIGDKLEPSVRVLIEETYSTLQKVQDTYLKSTMKHEGFTDTVIDLFKKSWGWLVKQFSRLSEAASDVYDNTLSIERLIGMPYQVATDSIQKKESLEIEIVP